MALRETYEMYKSRRDAIKNGPKAHFWVNQENRYVKPFKIYGNLYYVGDDWVCSHLVDTGDGLLLFDGGNCGASAMLVQAIWEAGFNPADVRWLIASHGHMDHIGAANFFRRMFGTKLFLGAPDAQMFRERPELSMIQESPNCMDALFAPDVEIQDGDVMRFGNTEIQFYLVPGHTEGCIACFFDVKEGEETKRAGYYGGFGFNTLQEEYLKEIGDTDFTMRRRYLESLKKVRDEKVDIFMGNHTANNDLMAKRAYMQEHPGENPFLDGEAWGTYLDRRRDELLSTFCVFPKE